MSSGPGIGQPIRGDDQVLRRAAAERRILVTIDKDFGELVMVQGMIHAGMIRLVGFRAGEQGPALVRLLKTYEAELLTGAILTAEPWRVRVRPASPPSQLPAASTRTTNPRWSRRLEASRRFRSSSLCFPRPVTYAPWSCFVESGIVHVGEQRIV